MVLVPYFCTEKYGFVLFKTSFLFILTLVVKAIASGLNLIYLISMVA